MADEPSSLPALRVTGLRKTFGDFVAVDGVDLEIVPGGSLAVVGESGSGKTTTARMIVTRSSTSAATTGRTSTGCP
ncbi:ATP-binding cassette domain-containing protein, partial [Streptomyces sp. NPDC052127]|uniref:ATP-binding cassette domain-containing protein n=1 Tax=Streptomyces sp. NPDC052127 TaxID=3155679 RepID=UPI00343C5D65